MCACVCLGGVKSEGVRNPMSEARDQLTKGGASGCQQSNTVFLLVNSDLLNSVALMLLNTLYAWAFFFFQNSKKLLNEMSVSGVKCSSACAKRSTETSRQRSQSYGE